MTPPWSDLDIAPTNDRIAIRRAYAARLKTIDVDADPDAFVALRESYDWANAIARQEEQAAESPPGDSDPSVEEAETEAGADSNADLFADAIVADESQAEDGAEADPAPSEDEAQGQADAHRLAELVYSDIPRADIYEEVGALTRRLLANPEMERIERAAAVERWMAEIIVHAIPRTNAMLAPAITYFGWDQQADEWHCPPLIQQVVARHRDCLFADDLAERPGPLGDGYRVLSAPPGQNRVSGSNADAVAQALAAVRTYYPTVEHVFDPETVRLWESFLDKRRKSWGYRTKTRTLHYLGRVGSRLQIGTRFGWIAFVVCLGLLRFCDAMPHSNSAPSSVAAPVEAPSTENAPLLSERDDIDLALDEFFHGRMRVADLDRNPSLYDALAEIWRSEQAQGHPVQSFVWAVDHFLTDRLSAAVLGASYERITEIQRGRLAEARYLQKIDAVACVSFLEYRPVVVNLPQAMQDAQKRAVERVLIETPVTAEKPKSSDRVMIPGPIVQKARAATGIDNAAFALALDGKGPSSQRCRARIALLAELLKQPPRKALDLLRRI